MGWTAEQLDAINEKNGNILVSAAAGSGKTAVLVERIIKLITDEEAPVDIDRLLVVTFTKAAAAEMKERIGAAVSDAIRRSPESVNLRRQAVLLNHADITTIHSFCLRVARDSYNRLGIDPAFRVADQTETELIKDEVLDELFEEKYASEQPEEFLYLVENYSDGTSDRKLKELVLKIYEFMRSCPDEKEWISKRKADYAENGEIWFELMKEQICSYLTAALEYSREELRLCMDPHGPAHYFPMISNDIERIETILKKADKDIETFYAYISDMKFDALSRKKYESDTKEKVKYLRDRTKKIFSNIKEKFFIRSIDEMRADIKKAGYGICLLLDLTEEFSERFDAEKRQRRIADYGDLEHYCLRALTVEGSSAENSSAENPVKSDIAKELTEKYAYVMTDEYQDSNAVQELILSLVSRDNNRIMVGDVKQSIYSFRQADPDIFTEKYNTFSLEKGAENERIDMFKNFRSRGEILDGINFIFMQLMQKELGGIDYDEKAMLYTGADFPVYTGNAHVGGAVEIDVISKEKKAEDLDDEDEDAEDMAAAEIEMNFVADRINSLMYGRDRLEVYDAALGEYRGLEFGDIAVIMRKKSSGAEFVKILASKGIPASAESVTDFLDTAEVMTAMSFLRIIDNPRQDIPLAAVLKSPVYGLSADDLLTIKLESGEDEYWDCVVAYEEKGSSERIKETLRLFMKQLEGWRDMAAEEKINDLIWAVYTDTGYYDLAGVMPEGKQRQANLLKLVKKAADYDSLSFKGLFDFIRYTEEIKKNDLESDSGSTAVTGGVRIMTIHKSKGLEFPVVFLSGCGSRFNKTDMSSNVIIHKKLGIGSEYTDQSTRVKYNTLPRAVIAEAIKRDSASEECRILYVAMTRAKEKLIITGCASDSESAAARRAMYAGRYEVTLPPFDIAEAGSFMEWILTAVARHRDGQVLRELGLADTVEKNNGLYPHRASFDINFINSVSAVSAEKTVQERKAETEEEEAFLTEQIAARLGWKYPYAAETAVPGSVSVSDVKRIRGTKLSHTVKKPDFYAEEKGLSAAEKGTAVHKVIEHMDFSKKYDYNGIKILVENLKGAGILSDEEAKAVSIKRIQMFADSDIYDRILKADAVYREEAFTSAVTPMEIYKDDKYADMDEAVILHGRIDCCFVENGEIVLLDYKTDRYDEDSERKFHERYDVQMELYTAALEKIMGMRVKECYIYSVASGKTIKMGQNEG